MVAIVLKKHATRGAAVGFLSETEKIRPRIEKYLSGKIIDIGCGGDKVCRSAIGVDIRKTDAVDVVVPQITALSDLFPKDFDVVFSSHCLEHIADDVGVIKNWVKLLNPGGLMVLYLPDVRYYTQHNPEHVHEYTYDSFMFDVEEKTGMSVVDSGLDVGDDRYSFFVVLKKST